MEIEIGDYIRTENGEIYKIIDTEKGSVKIKSNYKEWIGICCIVKHSKNIIDLIEVGDYVNGHKIEEKFYDYANKEYHLVTEGKKHIFVKDIKSIVTKEQFNSVSYEV